MATCPRCGQSSISAQGTCRTCRRTVEGPGVDVDRARDLEDEGYEGAAVDPLGSMRKGIGIGAVFGPFGLVGAYVWGGRDTRQGALLGAIGHVMFLSLIFNFTDG